MAEPTPTVYSYYSPEIEHTVQHALRAANSIQSGNIHSTLKQNYDPGLDELHLPLMEKYEQFARTEGVIGLDTFDAKYFTNGSSEGIFHLLQYHAQVLGKPIYQLEGEYQGYGAYMDAMNLSSITVKPYELTRPLLLDLPRGVIVLSNPSSVNGNLLDPAWIQRIMEHHEVIIDLAYMGMTRAPLNLDLTHPNIVGVLGSLSKPFGLYYYRIGFCYSRDFVPSLYGTKWFKNALSIKIGEAVLDEADPKKMRAFKDKYFALQERAVKQVNDLYSLDNLLSGSSQRKAWPSDVWLLANARFRDMNPEDLRPFKRADNYRFCLTPYYMSWRNG